MSFMQKQIIYDLCFIVETTHGSEVIPSDVLNRTAATHVEAMLDYLEGTPLDEDELVAVSEGWLCRLSAPGYMDCTPWSGPYETEAEAEEAIGAMYGEDDDE